MFIFCYYKFIEVNYSLAFLDNASKYLDREFFSVFFYYIVLINF